MSRIICRRLPTCDNTGFILQNIIPPLPPNIITCCLPCTEYPIVGDGTNENCLRIDDGNTVGDILQWDGTTWIITPPPIIPPPSSTVNTSFPVTGDGSILNPVTLINGTDCANNLQFSTQLNQWLSVEPGGATSASVGTFNALYPDVRSALAAGCTKLRIITDVTETNGSSLNLASAGDSVVIHIDPGVAWTPPPFSNTFNGISLTITGSSEGSSSVLMSPNGLSVPLFVGGLTDNFVMEGIHWDGSSGGGGSQLLNELPIIRISYSTVTLANTFFAFLGSFAAVFNDVLLSHVVIIGGGPGCADVIHAEAGSKITMIDIEIRGTFLIGSGITINSPQSVLDTLTSTALRFDIFVAGLVNNVQENTILNVINVNVYTPGTVLSNMRISSLAFEHDQCICSNTIARGNVTISGDQSATNLKITNLECANLSLGLTGPCSQVQLTQCGVTGSVQIHNSNNISITNLRCSSLSTGDNFNPCSEIQLAQCTITGSLSNVNTTALSIQTLTANSWSGAINSGTVTNWNLDNIIIATDVSAQCVWVTSSINALQLTPTSVFDVKNNTNELDISNSSLGVFRMFDGAGVLNNTNFSNITATSFTMNGLSAARTMRITNMTCTGSVTLGGSNSNTGNTVSNISCTTFTMGNTGAVADWTVSNVIANGTISIGGNVRNCHFSNFHGTNITLGNGGLQNCTFDSLQTEGALSFLLMDTTCTDNIFTNLQCTSDLTVQGRNNNITGVSFGQTDTSPTLRITGHRNCISNVNALEVNTSGISLVCRGNDNCVSNYYTSGSTAGDTQTFIVTGANNKFSNIQLGELNDLPIQSMTNPTDVIVVTGDYTGSRLTVGEYVTVSGTPTNDGTYRILALLGGATTSITVTPAIPASSGIVGTLSFPDVVVPPQALAPGNGINNSRPFGTSVSTAGTNVGIVEFGGVSNQYSNINIVPRSWFDTILNPAPPPVLIDVYRGVSITISSSLSHYTNLSIYKDAFHFTSPIPSPPAPNNAVPVPVAFQNVAITGELNRFDHCRIGPVANTSGSPGFGTFDASVSPGGSSNSILGSVNMFTPLGAFPGQWIQTSYTGGDGINNLY